MPTSSESASSESAFSGSTSSGSALVLPVIIVHYNTPALLARCLQALQHAPLTLLPIVVDTSSEVARANARQQVDALPIGHFITCQNHSLAHAVNSGLRAALTFSEHPALVCMNADVFVRPDAWQPLLNTLEQPHVGMVGPVCYDGQGRVQQQGVLYRQHHAKLHFTKRRLAKKQGYQGDYQVGNQVAVPWLSGCFQVVKRQVVLELGGMNSSLRFYNEDIEWCWRLRRAGWACHLVDTGLGDTGSDDKGSDDTGRIHLHQRDQLQNRDIHPDLLNPDLLNPDFLNHDIRQQKHPVVHLGGSATPEQAAFVVEGYRGGYRLSQMYRSPLYQTLHRLVLRCLLWEQTMNETTNASAKARALFAALRRGLAQNNVFESPFGDSLADVNPRFGSTHDQP